MFWPLLVMMLLNRLQELLNRLENDWDLIQIISLLDKSTHLTFNGGPFSSLCTTLGFLQNNFVYFPESNQIIGNDFTLKSK